MWSFSSSCKDAAGGCGTFVYLCGRSSLESMVLSAIRCFTGRGLCGSLDWFVRQQILVLRCPRAFGIVAVGWFCLSGGFWVFGL
jgi:hypothetical protein